MSPNTAPATKSDKLRSHEMSTSIRRTTLKMQNTPILRGSGVTAKSLNGPLQYVEQSLRCTPMRGWSETVPSMIRPWARQSGTCPFVGLAFLFTFLRFFTFFKLFLLFLPGFFNISLLCLFVVLLPFTFVFLFLYLFFLFSLIACL